MTTAGIKARVIVTGSIAVIWCLVVARFRAEWSVNPEYSYGWIVPFLCLYLAWQRRADHSGVGSQVSGFRSQVSALGILGVLALLYIPTRLILEANPIWRLPMWMIGLELVGVTLALVFLSGGWRNVKRYAFPVGFFLVAIPWPTGLRTLVVDSLTRLNIGFAVEALGWFNIPALQRGNVIEIGTGLVGIEEACSGLRSFQASLMIALFFGELHRFTLSRRLELILGGVTLAFVFNVVRTLILVCVASQKGLEAISKWHDPIGIPILVACFLGVWLLAVWMNKKPGKDGFRSVPDPQASSHTKGQGGRGPEMPKVREREELERMESVAPTLTAVASTMAIWFLLVEAGTEVWFQVHERRFPVATEWSVTTPAAALNLRDVPVPSATYAMLRYDSGKSVRWSDLAGWQWRMFYFRWLPSRAQMDIQTALLHRPESCLPAVGFKLVSELAPEILESSELVLPFRTYIFDHDSKRVHVFHCVAEDRVRQVRPAAGWRDRFAAAWQGRRHAGFRVLEIAVSGCPNVDDARAALRKNLLEIVRVGTER